MSRTELAEMPIDEFIDVIGDAHKISAERQREIDKNGK